MVEPLRTGIIVDSALTLQQALVLRQEIEPPQELLARLALINVEYYSFDGLLHRGQVLLDSALAEDVKGAFRLIKATRFPVFSVIPTMDRRFMEEDERAATENNSVAFSHRRVAGTDRMSNHSFGRALDLNPAINPYIRSDYRFPEGVEYDPTRLGALSPDGPIARYFKDHGWEWGGDWTDRKDYMHFEKPIIRKDNNIMPDGPIVETGGDSKEKEAYYLEQLGGIVPQAIFVLGGGNRKIEREGHDPRYTTSPFKGKFYPQKTGGAKARPVAAAELAQFYPQAVIVTMSHRPSQLFHHGDEVLPAPDHPFSAVLAQDLRRLRVQNEIVERPQSTSTFTEIIEAISFGNQMGWQNTAVIVSDYQKERAQLLLDILTDDEKRALLRNQLQFLFTTGEETDVFKQKWGQLENALKEFKERKRRIVFVPAEDILAKRDPRYKTLVGVVRNEPGYEAVVAQEAEGNKKIIKGEYNFAQSSFKEYVFS